jgi:VacB/RNase II family 3'-5' exoribonuclease
MSRSTESHRSLLLRVAREAMARYGLDPDFSPAAQAEAQALAAPAAPWDGDVRDLTGLPWCSIDNEDSRDLDQLTCAEALPGGGARIRVAVADVSAVVAPGSALDAHAGKNTASVYTPPQNFPMLPDRLSTDLTSLGPDVDRLAVVTELEVDAAGVHGPAVVYRAAVRNRAKLAYRAIGAWLEGRGPLPEAAATVPALGENLRLQDQVAQHLKAGRHEHGALDLDTLEVRARFDGDRISRLEADERNRARDLIEDFMIAANGAFARFLEERRFPVLRRVVRTPERWQRIVDIALETGDLLPGAPDSRALNEFLVRRRAADPLRFPDISLAVIKLLGRGEYVASFPGQDVTGHFGLAVREYAHSTAPNRRYPDLVTQRLLRAALAGGRVPYERGALDALAAGCTLKEDGAQKVERLMRKAAAACLLDGRVGEQFEGIVTGASPKGTWARILSPPVEGRIEQGQAGLDVGDRVNVRLVRADPEHGFIDFVRVGHTRVGRPR